MRIRLRSLRVLNLLMWAAVLVLAVAAVGARHEARKLFVELEQLNRERDQLNIDWGRLRIEQSTWATHSRVEQMAHERLDMSIPPPSAVKVLQVD